MDRHLAAEKQVRVKQRIVRSLRAAAVLFLFTLAMGTIAFFCTSFRRSATPLFEFDPPVLWLIFLGLAGVVFVVYLALGILGYRVAATGAVNAPRIVARGVVVLATVIVMGAVLALLFWLGA